MATLREEFSAEIDTYLESSGMNASEFGTRVLADPTFVYRLRKGREPKSSTIDRVRAFMRGNTVRPKRRGNGEVRAA